MTTASNEAAYSAVDPWIVSFDTAAEIAFLVDVFGATERGERVLNPDGAVGHAELALGDSVLMLFDVPAGAERPTSALRVYVDDAGGVVERATLRGARVVTRPTELAWGELVARFRDPEGHLWWVHQRTAELTPEQMGERFADSAYQQNMAYVQQSLFAELGATVGG